ncbi:MAG: hypothetical protein O3A30_01635 [Bacteroidetes bacterium]|nr:hypothetical protein [Bacteroidota bacterium]
MKKTLTLFFALVTILGNAQDFTTFGLAANPGNLLQNPGADPMTRFHLQYFGLQNELNMSETAGNLLATTDILQNIHELSSDEFTLENETQIDALQIGLKLGNNFIFAGNSTAIGVGFTLDNDFASFVKNGMADSNGDLNLNYSGNFDALGLRFQMTNSTYFGLQRTLLEEKLRVGFTYHLNNYIAGAQISTNAFSISSTANTTTGMNALNVDYDFALATTGVFNAGTSLDSLSQLSTDVIVPISLAKNGDIAGLVNYGTTGSQSNGTIGFGVTYSPIKQLDIQLSMSGLGASDLNFNSTIGKSLSGNATIDGFSYTSAAGDTLASAVSSVISDYTESIQNGISTDLLDATQSLSFRTPQVTNVALKYNFTKYSYLGAHYVDRKNSWNDYTYLGFNTMLWLGRNVQLKGGYYMAMNEMHNDRINAALQLRLTPVVQFYIGTTTVGDVATITNEVVNGRMGIGTSTSSINISTGVSMAFFDNRFKKDDKEEKAKAAKSLSRADKKKVDSARNNSKTTKDNK